MLPFCKNYDTRFPEGGHFKAAFWGYVTDLSFPDYRAYSDKRDSVLLVKADLASVHLLNYT